MVAASPLRAAAVPSVVFLVVASSPPPTTSSTSSTPATSTASSTSSTTTSVRALRAHGLHRAVRVLRRLLRAPPPRPPDHQALRQIVRGYLVASSSTTSSPSSPSTSTPSSTPATAGCIGIFFLAVLLRLRPSWRPSLLVPQTTASWWCTLPRTSGLGNTGACHRPRCIHGSGKPGDVSLDGVSASTAASTLSSTASTCRRLRLRRRLRYASTMALPSAPAASCAAPYHRRPRQLTIDHGYPTHDFLDHGYLLQFGFFDIGTKGYHPHEFLAGSLQSQHPHCADATTAGGCQSVGSYLRLLLQSHRLQCSRCDCGGMLEYIW